MEPRDLRGDDVANKSHDTSPAYWAAAGLSLGIDRSLFFYDTEFDIRFL